MLLDKEVPVVRATLAWIFTLIAGFAAFLGVATLVLLPLQAGKNRVIYAKAEQYAASITAGASLPLNAEVDDAFTHNANGVRFWRSRPGGCQDLAFEASSDQLVLGFWDNGSNNAFNTTWWHCYAYPSGKTTLHLTAASYLESGVGTQVLAYLLIAVFAGLVAWLLGFL